ncbi:MAG: hypothetical protein ABSB91_00240 [Sedimentisphaerales bacterium]
MAKDVNIHVKTEGTQQVQQDLQGLNQDVNRVGDNIEQMGSRSSRAMEWFGNGLKSLAGPLGFAALIGVVSNAAGKISQFFEDLKNRCDESVNKLQNLRKGFEGIFEAMGAFDEKGRKDITKGTIELLNKTAVSPEIGLPVIEAYTRQFKGLVQSGKLSPEQYQQGLEEMLGYSARRGQGGATPELITLMAGLGMNTPEQQGTFRRQIGAVSKATGLKDAEIIESLGRSSPTAKVMGWQPDEALNAIGIIAGGEIGRKRLTLPAATLEALVNPQLQKEDFLKYRISPQQAENPAQLFALLAAKQGTMDEQSFGRMLKNVYGPEGAAGVYKLLKSPGGGLTEAINGAATPQAASAEMADEIASRQTKERLAAKTQMTAAGIYETPGNEFFYKKQVREIGAEELEKLRIEHPYLQKIFEILNPGYAGGIIPGKITGIFKTEEINKENAAFVKWFLSLSDEEKQEILSKTKAPLGGIGGDVLQLKNYYNSMTPQEQYQDLTRQGDMHIHYHNDMIIQPNINPIEKERNDRSFK